MPTSDYRYCTRCDVYAKLDRCWLCDGPVVAGQGDIAWNSSHTWRQDAEFTMQGGVPVAIEKPEPASII